MDILQARLRESEFAIESFYFLRCIQYHEDDSTTLDEQKKNSTFEGIFGTLNCSVLMFGLAVGLCRSRFQKNRNSDSLTVFDLFSGIDSGIVGQENRKMNQKGIVFRFTLPPFR